MKGWTMKEHLTNANRIITEMYEKYHEEHGGFIDKEMENDYNILKEEKAKMEKDDNEILQKVINDEDGFANKVEDVTTIMEYVCKTYPTTQRLVVEFGQKVDELMGVKENGQKPS